MEFIDRRKRMRMKNILLVALTVVYMVSASKVVENVLENGIISYVKASYSSVSNQMAPIGRVYMSDVYVSSALNSLQSSSDSSSYFSTIDPRIVAMRKFLRDYNSPMYAYADVFIYEADKYGLNWRLVASISGVESAFGNLIPVDSNNGWGWRGGPGGAYSKFPTWKDGIETVTQGLAQGYGIELTPFEIEGVYCPPCGENPAHVWANGVQMYMNELDYYLENLESM